MFAKCGATNLMNDKFKAKLWEEENKVNQLKAANESNARRLVQQNNEANFPSPISKQGKLSKVCLNIISRIVKKTKAYRHLGTGHFGMQNLDSANDNAKFVQPSGFLMQMFQNHIDILDVS
jgi:hypothetical protein